MACRPRTFRIVRWMFSQRTDPFSWIHLSSPSESTPIWQYNEASCSSAYFPQQQSDSKRLKILCQIWSVVIARSFFHKIVNNLNSGGIDVTGKCWHRHPLPPVLFVVMEVIKQILFADAHLLYQHFQQAIIVFFNKMSQSMDQQAQDRSFDWWIFWKSVCFWSRGKDLRATC